MRSLSRIAGLAAAASITVLAVAPAAAKCTRLGFSVNDYGKDGPTRDAKSMLDGYIAKWAADNKITKYNVGKKDVSCELFLNFIVFDEHTCRAEATVCFTDPPGGVVTMPQEAKASPIGDKPKKAAKADVGGENAAAPVKSRGPVVTRSKAPTETGTVPAAAPAAKVEAAKPVTAPVAAPTPPAAAAPAPTVDRAAEAAASAEKAAAAAERAAIAAERAAAAAKQAPAAVSVPAAVAPAAAAKSAQ